MSSYISTAAADFCEFNKLLLCLQMRYFGFQDQNEMCLASYKTRYTIPGVEV